MKKGRKLGQIGLNILKELYEIGQEMARDDFKLPSVYRLPSDYHLPSRLRSLENGKYIDKSLKKNQSFFHLTPKGRLQILKYLHLEKFKLKKWDKQWRLIIFDIPEDFKKWREYLRRELKELGFHPLQKSVYITPYPVTGELDRLLLERNLRKFFRYLTVSEIDDEKELKKVFKIK
ncbi:hypothetical protein D4R52_02885 [bacterium]|nr:MAG: hypothetical protein D4R52_02885 [bacterium]